MKGGELTRLRRRVKQLEELLDLCTYLSSSLDVPTTLSNISALCRALFNAQAASIMLLDEKRGVLGFEAMSGERGRIVHGRELGLNPGVEGRVVESAQPVVVNDCQQDPCRSRFDELKGVQARALMCIPLIARGRVVGVMEAVNKPDGFTDDDVELAMSIGSVAASAVMNARLFDDLKAQQAQTVQAAKLAALGTIASGIAHELNQPLTGILGFVQLLERELRKGRLDRGVALERLAFIEKQVQRMTDIIGHVRTFARVQPVVGRVDVNNVVNDALTLMREQLRSHGIDLQLRLGAELPRVAGDAGRLEEVVINLLANARDAIEEHVSKGVGAAVKREIRVTTSREGKRLVIEVADTGTGIDPEVLPRIFEPFYTTRTHGRGTGLGLSISHGIIRDHGGTIEVQSRPGEGTTFLVHLPLEPGWPAPRDDSEQKGADEHEG